MIYLLDTNTCIGYLNKFDGGNIENPITIHEYLYGNGNPVIIIDPSGKISIAADQNAARAIFATILTLLIFNIIDIWSSSTFVLTKVTCSL